MSINYFKSLIMFSIVIIFNSMSSQLQANDTLTLETVTIKGNRELPKVLYIVPWKRLKNNNVGQKLILHSLFKDAFEPLEPEAFQRYIEDYKYYNQE